MYEGIKVASDAVNHAILLKLERYGVSSHSLQRFNSYLTDRKVRVRIGNSFSDEQTLNMAYHKAVFLAQFYSFILMTFHEFLLY